MSALLSAMVEGSIRIKPYDGTTDFAMWKVKMKAILIKEKCWKAVSGELPKDITEDQKLEMDQIAHLKS